jgi:hypothetical protein
MFKTLIFSELFLIGFSAIVNRGGSISEKPTLAAAGEKACAARFFTCGGLINLAVPGNRPQGGFLGRRDEISSNSTVRGGVTKLYKHGDRSSR